MFAFPVVTGIIYSPLNSGSTQAEASLEPAALVPVADAGIRKIQDVLSRYAVESPLKARVARAIIENGRRYDLDPMLIASIVIVESHANPFAISPSDSVGIMQIHLPTWGRVADSENINLFRPEDNIALGVRILKGYVRQHGLWEGVKRYRGLNDSDESQLQAENYVTKVKEIYQPALRPSVSVADLPAPPGEAR